MSKMLLHIGLQHNLNCALCWYDSKYTHSLLYKLQTQMKQSYISLYLVDTSLWLLLLPTFLFGDIVGRLMQDAERRQQG